MSDEGARTFAMPRGVTRAKISQTTSHVSQYGKCATVPAMRLVGKRALVEFEGSIMARRRLSLWCREVAAANWRSMSDVCAAHQRADVVRDDHVRIEFTGQSVFVEAAISFPVALVCIERVGLLPTHTA